MATQGDVKVIQNPLYNWNGALPNSNYTLFSCTGTASLRPDILVNSNDSAVWISGRLRITNFVRTGGNPGIVIKTGHTFPKTVSAAVGFRFGSDGKSLPEIVNATINTNGDVAISTTETTANAANGELDFLFYGFPIIF